MEYEHVLESVVNDIEHKFGGVKVVKKSIDISNKGYVECSLTYRLQTSLRIMDGTN